MSEFLTDDTMTGFVIGVMVGMVLWELYVSYLTRDKRKKDDNEQ